MTASGKSVSREKVHGKGVSINDFDSAVPRGALHAAALESAFTWH